MIIYLVHEIVICEFSKTLQAFKSKEEADAFVLDLKAYNETNGFGRSYIYEVQEVTLK